MGVLDGAGVMKRIITAFKTGYRERRYAGLLFNENPYQGRFELEFRRQCWSLGWIIADAWHNDPLRTDAGFIGDSSKV